MALLEDCISAALPPRTRPTREELSHNSSRGDHGAKHRGNSSKTSKHSYRRNASSGDELERSGEHDSRYSNWRQQPHKSSDEIFRKPTVDAKGRPCRRSRSQDSEKHYKDISNQQLARYGTNVHRGSWDSVAMHSDPFAHSVDIGAKQRQQLISETQNIVHQVQKMTRSVEKGDDRESEKTDSPASDYNFFMTCSGNTEISVESISKQSFPSSMAPDTDDDILDGSLVGSYRFGADGDENSGQASHDVTLTERNVAGSQVSTSKGAKVARMETSITSEDERALAENANIVMSEMMSRMVLSGTSTVDEDSFIENETLSLVSNGYLSDTASEASNTWSACSDFPSEGSGSRANGNGPGSRRPRILKPGNVSETQKIIEAEVKGVRGRRKPLYSSKSVPSPTPSATSASKTNKCRTQNVSSVGKISPRTVPGASSPSNVNQSTTGKKSLRTMPQASSTPVKTSQAPQKSKASKVSPPQRSSSLDQRAQQSLKQVHGYRSSSTNRSESINRSDSANRSGSANRSASSNRSTSSTNKSQMSNSPSKIPSKSNARQANDTSSMSEKPRSISKQGTFIKETTNKNAPVISPDEKNKENIAAVRMRQKGFNESNANRNSSGSSKSNYSNTSNNSNSFSTTSSDSPPDSWSKALSSYTFASEQTPNNKKDSKLKKTGTSELKKSAKPSMNSKIPSPCKPGLNKSGSGQSLKSSSSRDRVTKSSSGVSLTSVSSGLIKTGSNNSLKQSNSRPTTPVNMSRKGSSGSETNKIDKKQNGKKGYTSKISGLWKSEDKEKSKTDKKSIVSKLPIAKGKGKSKDNKKKGKFAQEEAVKRESSPRPNVNRNTYILEESVVEGLNRSSTYDKLDVTNDKSQIPSHDNSEVSSVYMKKSASVSSNEGKASKQIRSIFDDNELNKTCRDFSAFEIGVEYNLDDAWASNVEKSIEVMSKSIEDSKNKKDSFYDDTVDTSRMDLTGSPAKRLSKSGSMSEIELEFGRIHSGTWTKKKSHNDYATLPHAEDTSRTLPLVKRSESLNFSENLSVSHYDYDENQEVWIRRDDRLRASDISGMSTKKKKAFRGSSGFLNAVSKMFGGGSKKSSDKQSKSMIVSEKEGKKVIESSAKQNKKEKENKMNKSEVKLSKAEQKQLKAELKAQAKLNKSESKANKKEAKLNKSMKFEKKYEIDDNSSQTLGSSTSSLKRSAEYLIDIDKSDDESENMNMHSFPVQKTDMLKICPKSPDVNQKRNDETDTNVYTDNSNVPFSNNVKQTGSNSICANRFEYEEADNSEKLRSSLLNSSVKSLPTQHLTKTEMLLARRQAQLNSSSERSESEDESTGRKRSIVTTV